MCKHGMCVDMACRFCQFHGRAVLRGWGRKTKGDEKTYLENLAVGFEGPVDGHEPQRFHLCHRVGVGVEEWCTDKGDTQTTHTYIHIYPSNE